jgi:hypothetical protein
VTRAEPHLRLVAETDIAEAVILPPAHERWRAVIAGRIFGAWDLGGLMDELEIRFPPPATPPVAGEGRHA